MGNFSVSHYTRIELSDKGAEATYVLDLAEIPTFELLRDWKLDAKSAPAALEALAELIEVSKDDEPEDPSLPPKG